MVNRERGGVEELPEQVNSDIDNCKPLLYGLGWVPRKDRTKRRNHLLFSLKRTSPEQSSTRTASSPSSYSSKKSALSKLLVPADMLNKRNSSLLNQCLH